MICGLYVYQKYILLKYTYCLVSDCIFPVFKFKMGRLNIFYFSMERLISFLLCFSLVCECFILIFSFQESISHPCCLAASGWARTGARNEEEGPRPWKPSHVSGWMSLYLPPFPDRVLDQKLYLKQELCFSQQILKAIFPVTEVPCSHPASHFSGAAWVTRPGPVPRGAPPPPATLSLVTANEPENSLKRQDPAARGLSSFVCMCVMHKKSLFFLRLGHFLPSFTTDLYI